MRNYIKGLFLLFVVVGVFSLTACDKAGKIDSRVIGTWEYQDEAMKAVFIFEKDGTGSQTIIVGEETVSKKLTYETKDSKLFITYEGDTDAYEQEYSVKEDGLGIKDSFHDEYLYKKK